MTPEQIDTVTDGLIALTDAVDTYGPGLVVATAIATAWHTSRRVRIRRSIRRLEHLANHPGARAATDQPRKEKP